MMQQQARGMPGVPGANQGYNQQNYNQQSVPQQGYNQPQQNYNYQNRQNNNGGNYNQQPGGYNQYAVPPEVFQDGYQPEYRMEVADGDYLFSVKSVSTGYTKDRDKMIQVRLNSQNIPFEMQKTIVKNDFFNMAITEFFECFGIQLGNFNFSSWIGSTGICTIASQENKNNGKTYRNIVKMLPKNQTPGLQNNLAPQPLPTKPVAPPAQQNAPNQQRQPQNVQSQQNFPDDIPF